MAGLPIGSSVMPPSEIAAQVQGRIEAGNTVVTAKASWQYAVRTYKSVDARTEIVLRDLKAAVIGLFGEDSPVLADFHFAPRKKPVLSAEQKKAAAEKRLATRKARHTMGPKAKLKITGETAAQAATVDPANPAS
jgi:hypothetical protein